jgi:NADPH:quinone reductase-like Zn-dependent oxidoreductase
VIGRAVAIPRTGGPEVLEVIEREVPEPGEGEVRIRVSAAAVNPSDIATRERGSDRSDPPWVGGWDAAGVVESVGAGVDRPAVGDEVMAVVLPAQPGAQQELVVIPAGQVVPIPDGASFEQAATLPMNGLTAMRSLELLGLDPGRTLVVTGGAGQLASYAIPLAKERGLHVIADAGPDDEEAVRSFGADVVVPRSEGFVDAVREVVRDGADGLLDTALLNRDAFPAIRDGGVLVPLRGWSHGEPERAIDIRPVLVWEVVGRTDWLNQLRERASKGRLKLRVAGTYPPERAADAHRAMEAGGLRGRAVIVF